MTAFNRQLVRNRAREIHDSLEKIRRYTTLTDEEFFADERNLYTVMHLLLIAIEAVAALCNHILAKKAGEAPSSYAECFAGMRDLKLLDDDLATRLVRMARFRNLLVHRYWEIDPAQVLRFARENLGDFTAYLQAVAALVGDEVVDG